MITSYINKSKRVQIYLLSTPLLLINILQYKLTPYCLDNTNSLQNQASIDRQIIKKLIIKEDQNIIASFTESMQIVDRFVNHLEDREKFVQASLSKVIENSLGHGKYPCKELKSKKYKNFKLTDCGVLYQTRTKIKQRQVKYLEKNKQVLILSDLLVWFVPNVCAVYMGLMNYFKKWKQQDHSSLTQQNATRINQACKLFLSETQSKFDFSFLQGHQIRQQDVLRIPLLIISEYFEKWLELGLYYEEKQKEYEEKLLEEGKYDGEASESVKQNIQKLKHLLQLSRSEKVKIQGRVKQAHKYIQLMDSTESLDPQVYKNRLILSQYKPALNPKNKYLYRYGKQIRFVNILKKRAQKAQKHTKQRRQAINQLIDKQKIYIDGLQEYIAYIKHPIQALKVLSQDEQRMLFGNIQQIKKFHQQLYSRLMKRYQHHHKYQTYGDIIYSVIPFFKLYIDYIYQAKNGKEMLMKLTEENQAIKNISKKYYLEKYKTATEQLLQPTYKIARYENMFAEILKNTNPIHKDYVYFTQVGDSFKHKLRDVNDTVDKIVRRNNLNQLQQQFGTQQQPLLKQNCQYLDQFTVLMINHQKFVSIILFAFTDVILIVQQFTRRKLKYIKVDEKFYVRRQQDSKVYRNVIKLHSSQGYITLSTGNDDKNLKKAEQMFQVLKNIQKTTQSKELIYVQVLGTEEIGSTSFAKYTEYIIEIKFMTLKKLLHLRFSQIANIVKIMQTYYKCDLGITEEEALKKTWFNNHKSKTIEDRKRTIQQLLQKLFNHQAIKSNPMFLLNYLNLPENFFQIAKKLFAQKIIAGESNMQSFFRKRETSEVGLNKKISQKQAQELLRMSEFLIGSPSKNQSQLLKKQLKQAFTLICATQIKLGRDIYHDLDVKVQARKQKAQKVDIYINIMPNNQVKVVRVTEFDTVQDVCNKLSKLLGLRSNRDFRLFHEIGKKQLRVLEHEQLILKLFSFPRAKKQTNGNNMASLVNNVSNVVQSMASSLIKVISPQTHPTLIFKKYYFLPFQIQAREWKKDLTRLRLLTYQVFAQVKEMKYQLNFDQYLIYSALLIYIQQDGDIDLQKIDPQIIHTIIPQTIFKLKNYTQQQWLKKIQPHLLKYQQQIKKVIQSNQLQLKSNRIKTDVTLKMALHFGHRHLASQIVLNRIKANPIYGSNLFYVQPYKKTYEQLKAQSQKLAYNMWLAVKVDSLSLLTPSSKQNQWELKYKDIEKINVYSQAIVFKTDDITNKQYRFNTYQSFEISQLVKYYKTLNQVMKQLTQDEKLSNQVRKYRSEIQRYRSTYENHQERVVISEEIEFRVK